MWLTKLCYSPPSSLLGCFVSLWVGEKILNMTAFDDRSVTAVMNHLSSFGRKTWRSGTSRMLFECQMEGLVSCAPVMG